jgi:hypothetical protein
MTFIISKTGSRMYLGQGSPQTTVNSASYSTTAYTLAGPLIIHGTVLYAVYMLDTNSNFILMTGNPLEA